MRAGGAGLDALPRGGDRGDVGDGHQVPDEDRGVSRAGPLDDVPAQDDLDRAGQGPGGDLVGGLLHPQALPVDEGGLLLGEGPRAAVAARRGRADQRLGVLEVLLDAADGGAALEAAEGAQEELGADLGGARDGADERGEAPDARGAEVAEAVDAGEAVEGDPELAGDVVLVDLI